MALALGEEGVMSKTDVVFNSVLCVCVALVIIAAIAVPALYCHNRNRLMMAAGYEQNTVQGSNCIVLRKAR